MIDAYMLNGNKVDFVLQRLNQLEEYLSSNMPFGRLITNPHLAQDDTQVKSPPPNANKRDLLIVIKTNELLSSAKSNQEIIFGNIVIENSITPNEKCWLQIKLEEIHHLNLLLSPFCWLTGNDTMIGAKLNHKANKYLSYYLDLDKFQLEPFLLYTYKAIRKNEQLFSLDLLITIKTHVAIKFEYFSIHFVNCNINDINKLTNCHVSQGQLQFDNKSLGFVWLIGSKVAKSGQLNLKVDINCTRILDNFLDGVVNFKVNHYNHGFPKIKSDMLCLKDCQISNFKLSTQITMSSFDYRIKPTFQ